MSDERILARLAVFNGLLALVLTCVGLYGLMSYSVERRMGEIGIRIAIGAQPARVLRMILRESLSVVFIGVVVGLAAAYAVNRLIASMLFGLPPTDPFTYGAVVFGLTGIALFAALLPACRAAKVDPVIALRVE